MVIMETTFKNEYGEEVSIACYFYGNQFRVDTTVTRWTPQERAELHRLVDPENFFGAAKGPRLAV